MYVCICMYAYIYMYECRPVYHQIFVFFDNLAQKKLYMCLGLRVKYSKKLGYLSGVLFIYFFFLSLLFFLQEHMEHRNKI